MPHLRASRRRGRRRPKGAPRERRRRSSCCRRESGRRRRSSRCNAAARYDTGRTRARAWSARYRRRDDCPARGARVTDRDRSTCRSRSLWTNRCVPFGLNALAPAPSSAGAGAFATALRRSFAARLRVAQTCSDIRRLSGLPGCFRLFDLVFGDPEFRVERIWKIFRRRGR